MTKHTTGPWINRHFGSNGAIEVGSSNYRTRSTSTPMVRIYPRLDWTEEKGEHTSESAIEEAEANARLIASATTLLFLLERYVDLHESDCVETDESSTLLAESQDIIRHVKGD